MPDRTPHRTTPQAGGRAPGATLDAVTDFALGLRYDQLPPAVVAKLKWLLLDGVAAMAMGGRRDEGRRLVDLAAAGGADGGPCTVVGSAHAASFTEAALLNTALAQIQDCNDVRRIARRDGGSNHPGRCVVPVAVTVGEHARLSGRELVEVLAVGYEVVSRVDTQILKHEHSSATGAMVGRALGMGRAELRRAVALAHISFPARLQFAPLEDDYLVNGLIASAAVDAARLSRVGTGVPASRYKAALGTPFPEASASADAYAVASVSIKPYPCCRALHGAIDLALEVRDEDGVRAEDVERIEVRVGNKRDQVFPPVPPDAPYKACQFSVPYVVACALLDGGVGEASFERARIAAPDVQAMQAKVEVVRDERLAYNPVGIAAFMRPTVVRVTTTDGRTIERSTTSPRGSRFNPMSETELARKFVAWAGPSLGTRQADRTIRAVMELEDLDDVSTLIAGLRGHADEPVAVGG